MLNRFVDGLSFSAIFFILLNLYNEIVCFEEWKCEPEGCVCPSFETPAGKNYFSDPKIILNSIYYALVILLAGLVAMSIYERYREDRPHDTNENLEPDVENEYEKELKHYPGPVDPQFIDPITYEWMKKPVVFYTGNNNVSASYDICTARRILDSDNPNDPLTGKPIIGIVENLNLRQLIEKDVAIKRAEMKELAKTKLLASQSMFAKDNPQPSEENANSNLANQYR